MGMRRVGVMLVVAAPLAAADLILKGVVETPYWAYHQRTLAWAVLCCTLVVALAVLTRVPARLVPAAAGLLAGGVVGNGLSAAWNGLAVPNPLVLEGSSSVIAFNLADVWILAGIPAVLFTVAVWLVRNRHVLPLRRRSGGEAPTR